MLYCPGMTTDEMIQLYDQGLSLKEIGFQAGVSYQTVGRRLQSVDHPMRERFELRSGGRPRVHEVEPELLRSLQGNSVEEIARKLNIPGEVVRKRMIELGIPRLVAVARPGKNVFYKTGRSWFDRGYVAVRVPGHPYGRRAAMAEHRLVMESVLGRWLGPLEVVDHVNGCRDNNHPGNLHVYPTNAEHLAATLKGRTKQSRSYNRFDLSGPTPSSKETGAAQSLESHLLWPFVLDTGELVPCDTQAWPLLPAAPVRSWRGLGGEIESAP